MPYLYNKIKNFKSNKNSYIELKIEGPLEYYARTEKEDGTNDLSLKKIEDLICVNVYECKIEESEIPGGTSKVPNKKCIGKYVLTKDGEFIMSQTWLTDNLTADIILERVIRNLTEGKISIEILSKLPLRDWNKEFALNNQNLSDFIMDLYSTIETEEANKFNHPVAKEALLKTIDFNLIRIKELLDRNEVVDNL